VVATFERQQTGSVTSIFSARRRPWAALCAAALLAVSSCGGDSGADGARLPEVDLTDADGNVVPSASLVGEPLVVNFWYSTCPPCTKEMREFAAVHAERGDDVRFIGINPLDDGPSMVEFAAERGVTYELLRDELAEMQTELEITSFPVTLFVTSDGTILEQTGVIDEAGLESRIDELLDADGDASA
jgi:peroxiredoxin